MVHPEHQEQDSDSGHRPVSPRHEDGQDLRRQRLGLVSLLRLHALLYEGGKQNGAGDMSQTNELGEVVLL